MAWWPQIMPATSQDMWPMPFPLPDSGAANNCFQTAADVAAAAAGACTSGGPAVMAAQQMGPGMWCVFVADASATTGYQGMAPYVGCGNPTLMAMAPVDQGPQATMGHGGGVGESRSICLASHLGHCSRSSSSPMVEELGDDSDTASFRPKEPPQDDDGQPPSTPRAVPTSEEKRVEELLDIISTPPPKVRPAEEMILTPSPVGLGSPGRYRLGRSSLSQEPPCKELPPFPAVSTRSLCDDLSHFPEAGAKDCKPNWEAQGAYHCDLTFEQALRLGEQPTVDDDWSPPAAWVEMHQQTMDSVAQSGMQTMQADASTMHNPQQPLQVGRVHGSHSWHEHWNQGRSATNRQATFCGNHADIRVHAACANSASGNGSVTDSMNQHGIDHNHFHSNTNHKMHGNARGGNRRQGGGAGRGASRASAADNGNAARLRAQTNSSQQHAVHSMRKTADPVASKAAKEPADPLSPALWHIIEQVLVRRPELEAGKKVVVPFSEWLQDLPELDQHARLPGTSESSRPSPTRATVNRALRHMSKRLPGCAWTVDLEQSEIQVHLADVARFSSFCDGM
eukprot:TRINITY_DN5080_c0_g2_i1.p1 TRINITY_DN5080_c0_g2~~TRINITY_DN5080_c0_g2_i1.p1  ORF type:complete len:566 (+),score=112.25 TRINITY_DN5080_c0_g2_i1:252-1949(+)